MWNKFCLQVEKRESEQAVDRLYARNLIKNNCTKLSMPQNLCKYFLMVELSLKIAVCIIRMPQNFYVIFDG